MAATTQEWIDYVAGVGAVSTAAQAVEDAEAGYISGTKASARADLDAAIAALAALEASADAAIEALEP